MAKLQAPLAMVSRVPITPFLTLDRLTVEIVRSPAFNTKVPTWFFAPDWRERVSALGDIVMEWDSVGDITELDRTRFPFQAYLLRRRGSPTLPASP